MAQQLVEERFQQFENTREMISDLINVMARMEDPENLEESLRTVEMVRSKAIKGREEYQATCERKAVHCHPL